MKVKCLVVLLIIAMTFSLAVSCNKADNDGTATSSPTSSKTPAKTATKDAGKETATNKVTESAGGVATPTPSNDSNFNLLIPYGKATVDGEIDDAWKNAVTVELDSVKIDTPSEDTTVKASAMWDENAFYFLFEITDSDIYQSGAAGDWKNDGIYLYISESMSEDITQFASFIEGTYQFALINDELSMIPRYGDEGDDLKSKLLTKKTDTGMVIEFSYVSVYGTLKENTALYIDYQYNDCSNGARLGGLGWYNETDVNAEPYLWGYAKLLPKAA